jgi:hypothetical protein
LPKERNPLAATKDTECLVLVGTTENEGATAGREGGKDLGGDGSNPD